MAETTIAISETTLSRLRELARWADISVTEALVRAIDAQYDRQFWEAVNAGYAALRADPDGLDSTERWTEDRVPELPNC